MSATYFLRLSRDFLPRPLRSAQNLCPPPRRAAQRTPAAKREQFHATALPLEFLADFFKKGLHLFSNRVILLIVHGDVAQLGERSVRIREVEGSSPFVSTMNIMPGRRAWLFWCSDITSPPRFTPQAHRAPPQKKSPFPQLRKRVLSLGVLYEVKIERGEIT